MRQPATATGRLGPVAGLAGGKADCAQFGLPSP